MNNNKIKSYIGAALLAAMMGSSVYATSGVEIPSPDKICSIMQKVTEALNEVGEDAWKDFYVNSVKNYSNDSLYLLTMEDMIKNAKVSKDQGLTFHVKREQDDPKRCVWYDKTEDGLLGNYWHINKLMLNTDGKILEEHYSSLLNERADTFQNEINDDKYTKEDEIIIIDMMSQEEFPVDVSDLVVILSNDLHPVIKYLDKSRGNEFVKIWAHDILTNPESGKVVRITGYKYTHFTELRYKDYSVNDLRKEGYKFQKNDLLKTGYTENEIKEALCSREERTRASYSLNELLNDIGCLENDLRYAEYKLDDIRKAEGEIKAQNE